MLTSIPASVARLPAGDACLDADQRAGAFLSATLLKRSMAADSSTDCFTVASRNVPAVGCLPKWVVEPPIWEMSVNTLAKQLDADQLSDLDAQSMAVMISFETNPLQSHQDFADASRTKPLPPSLIAAYDLRNPANALVIDIISECPLFSGKIDSTSKTLSKKSNRLFLTNHIRQMVKTLLTGDPSLMDDLFVRKASDLLGERESDQYNTEKERIREFINIITNNILVFAELAPLPEGRERDLISERRSDGYICMTATGLLILAKIGYELFTHPKLYPDWQIYAARFGEIDWRKTATIWQNNIINSGKSFSNKGPLNKAVEAVKARSACK
jgi:hypothetical protein